MTGEKVGDEYKALAFEFPNGLVEKIKATRLRYGMNYVQITKIMGFGANQWKSYDDDNVLTESEIKTLTEVMERYGKLTTTEIIALSHEEEGWKKHQEDKSFIPYDEAFALKG